MWTTAASILLQSVTAPYKCTVLMHSTTALYIPSISNITKNISICHFGGEMCGVYYHSWPVESNVCLFVCLWVWNIEWRLLVKYPIPKKYLNISSNTVAINQLTSRKDSFRMLPQLIDLFDQKLFLIWLIPCISSIFLDNNSLFLRENVIWRFLIVPQMSCGIFF